MTSVSRAEKKFHSNAKSIAEDLRAAILSGKLLPGQRFAEIELTRLLNAGRIALRSALRRLEAEGYVTLMSRNEVTVNKPSLDEVEEYHSIAGALEGLAARLAVKRADAEDISRLVELHRALKEAYRAKDQQRYFNANTEFHRFIAEAAGNRQLYTLIERTRRQIQKSRILVLQLPNRLDYSMREHDAILDSFLKKNSGLAESLLFEHLNNQMTAVKIKLQSEDSQSQP